MKNLVIRVSDELFELITEPSKITPQHYHCLWCGMIKAFPKRVCEICGLHGNSLPTVVRDRCYVEYVPEREKAPAPRTVKRRKQGPRRVSRAASRSTR